LAAGSRWRAPGSLPSDLRTEGMRRRRDARNWRPVRRASYLSIALMPVKIIHPCAGLGGCAARRHEQNRNLQNAAHNTWVENGFINQLKTECICMVDARGRPVMSSSGRRAQADAKPKMIRFLEALRSQAVVNGLLWPRDLCLSAMPTRGLRQPRVR
jgi:hypothetical protein